MVKINEIIDIMEGLAPLNLKESYDNVGFMVGCREREVTKVLVALDCTIKVIEEAKELGVQFILTHHPLLFKKPKTITTDSLQGKKIMKLIENGIALYSSHTNWDTVKGGLNDEFVKILDFQESKIIEVAPSDPTAGVGRIVQLKEDTTLEEIDIGHFNSEWPLVMSLSEKIKKILEPRGVEVILSKATKDPYNFI